MKNKDYLQRIVNKADTMTPTQLTKRIMTLKTRGIERELYEQALINNVGEVEAQKMLKEYEHNIPLYLLKIYNTHDSGYITMLFCEDELYKLSTWTQQARLNNQHFEVIKLCKKHQHCKGLQSYDTTCCMIIDKA